MEKNKSMDYSPLHQTMAERFGFKCDGQAIAVEFTDQKLSANAGSAPFWAWLHGTYWNVKLAERLPHRAPASEDHLRAVPYANAHGGRVCGRRFSACFPTAIQSTINPHSRTKMNAYCMDTARHGLMQ
jgi:hypothetical protein